MCVELPIQGTFCGGFTLSRLRYTVFWIIVDLVDAFGLSVASWGMNLRREGGRGTEGKVAWVKRVRCPEIYSVLGANFGCQTSRFFFFWCLLLLNSDQAWCFRRYSIGFVCHHATELCWRPHGWCFIFSAECGGIMGVSSPVLLAFDISPLLVDN